MNFKTPARFLTTLFLTLVSSYSIGAEVSVVTSNDAISIVGPIVRGDYARLAKLIDNDENYISFLNWISLDSPGGDVSEAMKIAKLVDLSLARVKVPRGATCASSCFLIWSAGTQRVLMGDARLGVHRISWTAREIDIAKTEHVVRPVSQSIDTFLREVAIPTKIIDKMNQTSPKDISFIDNKWLQREDLVEATNYRPNFIDVVEKQCGIDPTSFNVASKQMPTERDYELWLRCSNKIRMSNSMKRLAQIRRLIAEATAKN